MLKVKDTESDNEEENKKIMKRKIISSKVRDSDDSD